IGDQLVQPRVAEPERRLFPARALLLPQNVGDGGTLWVRRQKHVPRRLSRWRRPRPPGRRPELSQFGFESLGTESLSPTPAAWIGDEFMDSVIDGDRTGIGFEGEPASDETMRHAVAIAVELQTDVFMHQRLDGISVVGHDDRQRTERGRHKTVDRPLSCFAMHPLIGDLLQPLACLAVYIVQIGEVTKRPEVLADVPNAAALHFSFLPSAGLIAGPRGEVKLAGEAEKARMESDQPSVMFGDGSGQVVIPDLACDSVELLEGMHVAACEGFETLAMGELQVLHAAVRVDKREGVEFTEIALVVERSEVTPIDLEAFAGFGFHADEGAWK